MGAMMDVTELKKRGARHLNPGATVSPEVFALVKFLEAVVTGTVYTIDGEVYACKKGPTNFTLPLEVEEFYQKTDDLMTIHLKTAMAKIYVLVTDIKKTGKRAVPATRDEVLGRGVSKKELKNLESLGLVQTRLINMTSTKTKRPIGARACVYFTIQGRAYVRKYFDASYGTERAGEWDVVRADPKWGEFIRRARVDAARVGGTDEGTKEVDAGLPTDIDQVSTGGSNQLQ